MSKPKRRQWNDGRGVFMVLFSFPHYHWIGMVAVVVVMYRGICNNNKKEPHIYKNSVFITESA
jgi:hypothetical protein